MTEHQHPQRLFIHRSKNKLTIQRIMKNLNWEANNENTDLSKSDSFSMEQLHAMRVVARMKEAADRMGAGFVGGFIAPNGQRFVMSNVESDDIQRQIIDERLDQCAEEMRQNIEIPEQIRKLLEEFEG